VLKLLATAGLLILPLVSGCSNAGEEAAVDMCAAVASANWDAAEVASDELAELEFDAPEEYEQYEDLREDIGVVLDVATIDPDNPMLSELPLMGPEGAMRHAEEHFNDAWQGCEETYEEMPSLMGDEAQNAWDDLGVNLYRLFS
jgi:hypothetical protein